MVLVSLGIIRNLSRKVDNFDDNVLIKHTKYIAPFTLGWIFAVLVCLNAIPAVLVAVNCHTKNPIIPGIIALIFSDLYLIQWSLRKFILKENNYCKL